MKDRCQNPNNHAYTSYGGRGITACPEWLNSFESFHEWATTKGNYADKLTIERLDVNGDYTPSNCTFVDMNIQSKNKRNTVRVTIDGVTKIWADWCRYYNVADSTIRNRVSKGMVVEEAFKTPVDKEFRQDTIVSLNGEKKTVKEWCEIKGEKLLTVRARVTKYGMPLEEALTKPVKRRKGDSDGK